MAPLNYVSGVSSQVPTKAVSWVVAGQKRELSAEVDANGGARPHQTYGAER
jgi:hypothetical protein